MSQQFQFRKATRERAKARIALIGPAGSGKTYTALRIAAGLGSRIAVIDTEHGSSNKYAGGSVDFDVLELDSFAPLTYVSAIHAAAQQGFDVLIVDSLSHAWMGVDGALEQVDRAAKRSPSGNSYVAWRDVTPQHNRMVEALVACPMHLIVTMRSKTEDVLVDVEKGGKTVKEPRKIGLAPIQRDGLEYEFDVVGDLDLEHNWLISKTRCELFDGAVIHRPGAEFAAQLRGWLETGEAPRQRKTTPPPAPPPESRQPAQRRPQPQSNGNGSAHHQQRDAARDAAAQHVASQAVNGNGHARRSDPPPPPATEQGPLFSASAQWLHADDWGGQPLSKAPLRVLLAYEEAVSAAIASPRNKHRIRVLKEHRDQVREAIQVARQAEQALAKSRAMQAAAAAAAAAAHIDDSQNAEAADEREPGQDDMALGEAGDPGDPMGAEPDDDIPY